MPSRANQKQGEGEKERGEREGEEERERGREEGGGPRETRERGTLLAELESGVLRHEPGVRPTFAIRPINIIKVA